MTFTYTPSDDIGTVRRLTGDTVEAQAELTDEEIQAWLDDNSSNTGTASVKILRSLAAKYARRATFTTGNEQIRLGDVSKNLIAAADALEGDLNTDSTLVNRSVGRMHDTDTGRSYSLFNDC